MIHCEIIHAILRRLRKNGDKQKDYKSNTKTKSQACSKIILAFSKIIADLKEQKQDIEWNLQATLSSHCRFKNTTSSRGHVRVENKVTKHRSWEGVVESNATSLTTTTWRTWTGKAAVMDRILWLLEHKCRSKLRIWLQQQDLTGHVPAISLNKCLNNSAQLTKNTWRQTPDGL